MSYHMWFIDQYSIGKIYVAIYTIIIQIKRKINLISLCGNYVKICLPDNAFLSSSLEISPGSCPWGPVAEPINIQCIFRYIPRLKLMLIYCNDFPWSIQIFISYWFHNPQFLIHYGDKETVKWSVNSNK